MNEQLIDDFAKFVQTANEMFKHLDRRITNLEEQMELAHEAMQAILLDRRGEAMQMLTTQAKETKE